MSTQQFTPEQRTAIQQESLTRAVTGVTMTNYPAIFEGFMAKGIPEHEIVPRSNVFTFNAWKALGYSVKKGEHGVKVKTATKRSQPVSNFARRRQFSTYPRYPRFR